MRQLDLFGSFIDTPPAKEKQEEKQAVSIKKENIPSDFKNEDISYSLVGLAEEMLGVNSYSTTTEFTETTEPKAKLVERSEQELVISLSENARNYEITSILTNGEELQITLPVNKADVAKEVVFKKQKEARPQSERNGEVIFQDEKIVVKVKNKPVTNVINTEVADIDVADTDIANTDIANNDIADTDIADTPVADTPVANTDVADTDIADTDVANTDVADIDVADTNVADTDVADTDVADTEIADTEIKIKKEPQKRGRKSLQEIESEVDLIEVPEDEELFKKQYYTISQVAKWFRVNTSLLRFWENEFDILKPKKNRKGDRLFRPEDVKNLQLIYQLLRQRKYTIEGAKEYIKTNKKKADIELQLTNTLQKFKSFLLDLKANL
jgi:DNA-binding transcriptional MerR regulator